MNIIQELLKEMDRESITTRKMLSIVPADKFDWQPHPKSMTLQRLAAHVAELPGWVHMALTTDELDFENNQYAPKTISSSFDLMNYFDESLQNGKMQLQQAHEDQLKEMWTLRSGNTIYSTESKYDVIRMAYCQIVHHRAQLGVYLRLLNIPIPGSYGPSADEMSIG